MHLDRPRPQQAPNELHAEGRKWGAQGEEWQTWQPREATLRAPRP
jgi:hypothetical protein